MKRLLPFSALAASCMLLATPLAAQDYDVIIRHGQILDGTGVPVRIADVGVRDGRIARIGDLGDATAERVINATGLYVTPGFIDMHSHADWGLGYDELKPALPDLTQGITTVVVGQDGRSAWRVGETIEDVIGRWSESGLGVNTVLLVGHGSVRREVMGEEDRAPTERELERMKALVRDAMRGGAYGISTGLSYTPGRYAETEEVIALTAEVAPYDGFYISHLRNQGDELLQSVDETVRIGRETGVPVVHTHFKSAGRNNFGNAKYAMQRIAEARRAGVDAWVDVYPWPTSSDGIDIEIMPSRAWRVGTDGPPELPDWLDRAIEGMSADDLADFILSLNGWIRRTTTTDWLASRPMDELREEARGAARRMLADGDEMERRDAFLRRLEDPVLGDSIRAIVRAGIERRGADLHVIEQAPDERLEGRTLAEAAEILGVGVVEAALRIDLMDATVTRYHMSEVDVEEILRWDFTTISTDGTLPRLGVGVPHPRSYGSFARLIRHYVMDREVIDLPEAIHASTGRAADVIGLDRRGYLRDGYWADIVVFDPDEIRACATFAEPHCYSKGIEYLLVNGRLALERGDYTGALDGRIITPDRDIVTEATPEE